jgi:AsmA protein
LETPLIQGSIEVESFDAREVAKRTGVKLPAMAKTDALSRVALKTKIKLNGEKLQANDFSFKLDDSTMTGWLHVLNISKQQIRYDLAFDHLNINDYMPPEAAVSPTTESVEVNASPAGANALLTAGDEKIELPVEMMRKLDVQGDFRIAALTAKEYEIKQLLMSLKAQQGVIAIKPLSLRVLEGQVETVVNINVQKQTPAYAINLKANQIQAGPVANPFLKNVQGEKPLKMEGAVNLTMDVNTAGDSVNQLKQASKGTIVLDMKETRVDGFDPEYYMRKSVADYVHSKGFGLSKTIMGKYKPREVTVFDRIHSTVKLADGKARTKDFIMDSKRVKITAEGYADIVKNTLDMKTGLRLPRGKTAAEKIFNEPQYVRAHGPFDALEFDLDKKQLQKSTTGALQAEAKAKLDAEKQKLKAKVDAEKKRAEEKAKKELKRTTDKYKDKLKNKLKGLF